MIEREPIALLVACALSLAMLGIFRYVVHGDVVHRDVVQAVLLSAPFCISHR